jgi:hypothetical protein
MSNEQPYLVIGIPLALNVRLPRLHRQRQPAFYRFPTGDGCALR